MWYITFPAGVTRLIEGLEINANTVVVVPDKSFVDAHKRMSVLFSPGWHWQNNRPRHGEYLTYIPIADLEKAMARKLGAAAQNFNPLDPFSPQQ